MKQTMNETLLFLLIKRKKTEDLNMDYYFDTTNVDDDDIMCVEQILQIPREKREGELGKRYNRLRKVRIVIESSLMKLDDSLLLFHDF